MQLGAVPVLVGQQAVNRGESQQALLEFGMGGHVDVFQGDGSDRLDDRERVLHAVIELVEQQLQVAFVAVALGDVGRGADGALDRPGSGAQRSGAHQERLAIAVVEAHFEQLVLHFLAARRPVQGPRAGRDFFAVAIDAETRRLL